MAKTIKEEISKHFQHLDQSEREKIYRHIIGIVRVLIVAIRGNK